MRLYLVSTLSRIKPSGPTLCGHYVPNLSDLPSQLLDYAPEDTLSTVAADTKTTPLHLAVSSSLPIARLPNV